MISLKDVAKSLDVRNSVSYNTDLFNADREYVDSVGELTDVFPYVFRLNTEVINNGIRESVVMSDGEVHVLVGVSQVQGFGGEIQTTITSQSLTLAGFNYFTKDVESQDLAEVYDLILKNHGYDFLVEDVKELGEYLEKYNCFALRFNDNGKKHSIVVNAKNQISSIKVVDVEPRAVASAKHPNIKPLFG